MRCILTNRAIGVRCFSIGTNRGIGTNGPSEWPCTLNEMHIHQQNHWNDMTFSFGTNATSGTNGPSV